MKHLNATLSLTRENVQHASSVWISAPSTKELIRKAASVVEGYALRHGISTLAVDYKVSFA